MTIKLNYPWPCPPPTPIRDGYRTESYSCHNCGSIENTLGVGTWLAKYNEHARNKLVLCKICYERLGHAMIGQGYIQSIKTRFRILFFGKRK